MILETAGATPTIDPTTLALLSIFGGALLTVGAGFVGAWIQSRREHAKWLRERRYEAFVAVRTIMLELESATFGASNTPPGEKLPEFISAKYQALIERHAEATAPLATLGPDEVHRASTSLLSAIAKAEDRKKIKAADAELTEAMRASLGIRPRG